MGSISETSIAFVYLTFVVCIVLLARHYGYFWVVFCFGLSMLLTTLLLKETRDTCLETPKYNVPNNQQT